MVEETHRRTEEILALDSRSSLALGDPETVGSASCRQLQANAIFHLTHLPSASCFAWALHFKQWPFQITIHMQCLRQVTHPLFFSASHSADCVALQTLQQIQAKHDDMQLIS